MSTVTDDPISIDKGWSQIKEKAIDVLLEQVRAAVLSSVEDVGLNCINIFFVVFSFRKALMPVPNPLTTKTTWKCTPFATIYARNVPPTISRKSFTNTMAAP